MAMAWLVPVRNWLRAHAPDALIGIAVLLAYWPLVTLTASLTLGDTMDCWLPWRWFIASSLQDGAMPWWNPLQQMGYPVHADLQGPAWYVEAIALGGTLGHGPITLQYLFLLYVMVGGWGMRRMVLHLGGSEGGSTLAGLCYALSGFFTGHAMHFFAVISAAWIPWAIAALLAFLDGPGWRTALRICLIMALVLTGGNHGLLILSAYPMAILVMLALWKVRHDRIVLLRTLGWGGGVLLVTALMAAGTLHAAWEVRDQVTRLGGLTLEQAQVNPLTIQAMASLVHPNAASLGAEALGTDPTMANTFMGATALVFMLLGAGQAIRGRTGILAITGLLSSLAALGPVTPVHRWCWAYLPGMDLFRFPGYFWYLTLIGLLPLAALGAQRLDIRGVRYAAIVLLSLLAVGLAVDGLFMGVGLDQFGRLLLNGSIPHAPALEGGLAPLLAGLLAGAMALVLATTPRMSWLLMLVALEGVVFVHATRSATAIHPLPPRVLADRLSEYPVGPVLPALVPMGANKDGQGPVDPLWRNTRVFQGGPSHDGFNSFWLSHHQRLSAEWPHLFATMLQRPLVSLSTHVRAMGSIADAEIDPAMDRDLVLVPGDEVHVLRSGLQPAEVDLLGGDHQGWTMRTRSSSEAFLLVQQSLYPGWRITVDGADHPVVPANVAAFGTWLPAGEHQVEVAYDRPLLSRLFWLSQGLWFLGLFALCLTGPGRALRLSLSGALLMAWCWSVLGHVPKAERLVAEWKQVERTAAAWPGTRMVVNTDRPLPSTSDHRTFRIDAPDRINALYGAIGDPLPDSLLVAWHGVPLTSAMRAWLLGSYGPPKARWEGRYAGVWCFVRPAPPIGLDTLYRSSTPQLLGPASPYTQAFRFMPDTMSDARGAHLVVHASYQAAPSTQCHLVIEQRRGEEVLSYEAVPLELPTEGPAWNMFNVVRPVRAIGPGAEWGAYFWNASSDSVQVREWSVMVTDVIQ